MRSPIFPTLCAVLSVMANLLAYDPLALPESSKPAAPLDLTVTDAARNREIPLRIYLPAKPGPAPVVIFSHGLGGTREGSAYLGEHWAARGFVAVYTQHHGSDDAVWKNAPANGRQAAMSAAASVQNALLRIADIPATLDQLAKWNQESGHALFGRLDLEHVGMSGHSFGAVTTELLSGESSPTGHSYADPRIRAAIAMSPSPPRNGDPKEAFATVKIPWLIMTGTKDSSPIGNSTPASRLAVFPLLPPGDKYELVLNDAEHSAFTDRALPGDKEPRNPNHHRVILALSTAFWDTYLRNDTAARDWLQGDGPQKVMEPKDHWQKK